MADGGGYDACICPIRKAVVGDAVVQLDQDVARDTLILEGERAFSVPVQSGESVEALAPGDFVHSWELGLMGRVTEVVVEGERLLVQTEPCALTDVFETLEIDFEEPISLAATLPEEMKETMRALRDAREAEEAEEAQPKSALKENVIDENVSAETEPVSGLTLSAEGNIAVGIDLEPDSYIDIKPQIYTKVRIKNFKLQHLAIDTSLEAELLLKLRVEIEASVSANAELDIIKMAAYFATGQEDYVFRVPLAAGIDLEIWALVGIGAELDGFVETVPYFETSANAYGGVYFSRDWDDEVWDTAPERIQTGRGTWNNEEWYSLGDSTFSSDAGLDEFSWGAHGGVEAYLKAKYALSFLRCGGPTFDVQPYARFDAWIGSKNKLESSIGIRGHAGGKIEVFGKETIWEESWDLFDYNYILWEYSWMLCGDGIRSTECYDLTCDHCPNSGCGGHPEECDAGLMAHFAGQGVDEWDSEKPCIPPGQPDACTCGVGWIPSTGDEWFWSPESEDDVQWGDRQNFCVRACGDGVVQSEEGEVCEHFGNPGCDSNCNSDCTEFYSTCGNGIVECYEQCDDGNTDSCDGCSEYCTQEPGTGGCGDGYRCGTEKCDDGNEVDCDDCHNNCERNTGCGDGIICDAEECDDGNIDNCDACHNNCVLDNGCGDGVACGDERCDDGNHEGCDSCSTLCRLPGCGDGDLCGAEVCDDGNTEDNDGCNWNCKGTEVCGDGIPDFAVGEWCDDGNLNDCDDCHNDCTINPPVPQCGDGHVCGDEVCDDANNNSGDGCSPSCNSDESCGNGILDSVSGEECDDGNTDDCDGCTTTCKSTACGDGFVCGDEVCDDGNTLSGDGCRGDCMGSERCGDGLLDENESCDDSTDDGVDEGCLPQYPDCVLECGACKQRCGDGIKATLETCDINSEGTDFGCTVEQPICASDCNVCLVDCSDNICGDNKACPGEACDDGNTTGGDGCSFDCLSDESCGNGIKDGELGEVCDDGNTRSGDGCRSDCMAIEECGNNSLDEGERCDNTSVDGRDAGCSEEVPDCILECTSCTAHCGDGLIGLGEACEDTSAGGQDLGCEGATDGSGNPLDVCKGDCVQCIAAICGDGFVNGTEVCDEVPVQCTTLSGYLGLQACGEDCYSLYNECTPTEYCGDGITQTSAGELCDDADNDSCTTGCSADCKQANVGATINCGNGVLDCGEVCDGSTGDYVCVGCVELTFAGCGNGVVERDLDEVCDDGNTLGADGCSADCKSDESCGNNVVDVLVGEVCDDGNTDDCKDRCSSDCKMLRVDPAVLPACGNGVFEFDAACEICEDSDPSNTGIDIGCTTLAPHCTMCRKCSTDLCGNLSVEGEEDCDFGGSCVSEDGTQEDLACTTDHSTVCKDNICRIYPHHEVNGEGLTQSCWNDCQESVCGDGVISSHEQCEDTAEDVIGPVGIIWGIDEGCNAHQPVCNQCGFCTRPSYCGDWTVNAPHEACDVYLDVGCDVGQECLPDCTACFTP